MSKLLLTLVRVACIAVVLAGSARLHAQEVIHSFHADIEVKRDGSLRVTETIRLNSEKRKIRHGIYRDFPARTLTGSRLWKEHGFDVKAVRRDGEEEPYHFAGSNEAGDRGEGLSRIYIGDADRIIPPARHTYELTYETNDWLIFQDETDELHWNVTGQQWRFPIEQASATIILPEEFDAEAIRIAGWTGAAGSMDQNWRLVENTGRRITVETTQRLDRREGLTVSVRWPSGTIEESRYGPFAVIADNLPTFIALLVTLIVAAVYIAGWRKTGHHVRPGPITPTEQTPAGFSPAAARHLDRLWFDHRCVAAALVSAAETGAIVIHEELKASGTEYRIEVRDRDRFNVLPLAEAELLNGLLKEGAEVALTVKHRTRLQSAVSRFREELKKSQRGRLYNVNWEWLLSALSGSVFGLLIAAGVAPNQEKSLLLLGGLVLGLVLVGGLAAGARAIWRMPKADGELWLGCFTPFMAMWAVVAFVGASFAFRFFAGETTIWLATMVPLHLAMAAAFSIWRLRTPTAEGRRQLDKIDAFKQWLVSELPARLRSARDEKQAAKLYERHLPWILALDVKPQSPGELAAAIAVAAGQDEQHRYPHEMHTLPSWYHSTDASVGDLTAFVSSLGAGISSAVSTSTSNSGGGGGTGGGGGGGAGGGGGGGGGGGW